ncbi:MAG TPA: hypothetical protein VLN73_03690, partial [Alphaproteobacteria bacterium]|nr:hypothetical protein [Alphaproteobacteria bacterium]
MKVIAFLIAFPAAAGLFLLFPGIDIGVSGLFYRPGEGFFLAHWPPARALYDLVTIISWTVSLAFIGWLVARALGPLKRLHVRSSAMIYIALSL